MPKKPILMQIEQWPIDKPIDYPKNARVWSKHAIAKVADSIRAYGFRQPIVVDKHGVICIGHLRRTAARSLGMTEVPVHVAKDLSAAQIRGLRLMDNRSAQEATSDLEALGAEFLELKAMDFDLSLTGFDIREIDSFTLQPNAAEDDVPPVPEAPVSQLGDLWIMGDHRLLCGDSTKVDDVTRLMNGKQAICTITDPPYNVGFDYGSGTDDSQNAAGYLDWNRRWFAIAKERSEKCVVLTCGITNLPLWIGEIERTHRIIAWVKENQCSRNYIGETSGFNVWEPVLVYGKSKKCVARDSFSIPISIQSDTGDHPCPKSLKAWSWLVENFSDGGDLLFDPFSGCGTTIIAAQNLNRTCYGLEISPAYCDVILKRFMNITDKSVTLSDDGRAFNQIAAVRQHSSEGGARRAQQPTAVL